MKRVLETRRAEPATGKPLGSPSATPQPPRSGTTPRRGASSTGLGRRKENRPVSDAPGTHRWPFPPPGPAGDGQRVTQEEEVGRSASPGTVSAARAAGGAENVARRKFGHGARA